MRLLDLFCGAGGAAMGYHRAGFDVVGVDNRPQPRYPFELIKADAMQVLASPTLLAGFDVVHASPPCQRYSMATRNIGTADRHPDLLPTTRELLAAAKVAYVIENVPGAPMRRDVELCGCMFGLNVRRRRWFELHPQRLSLVPSCHHVGVPIGVYGNGTPSWHRQKLGRNTTVADWRQAMGIDWMTRDELAESIPPAYTQFIGDQLREHLDHAGRTREATSEVRGGEL